MVLLGASGWGPRPGSPLFRGRAGFQRSAAFKIACVSHFTRDGGGGGMQGADMDEWALCGLEG